MPALLESADGSRNRDAVTGKNQRSLGSVEQFHRAIKLGLVMVLADALWRKFRSACIPVKFGAGLLRVFRDVDQYRAGAPAFRDDKRFANRPRNVFRAGDHHVVLGDRHGDAGDVDFLKRIGAQNLAAHLPGDADHRRRIQHGGRNAGHHVRGARAGRGHRHPNAAACPRITVGHVRGALLVTYQDVMQFRFAQRVVNRQNRAAGIAEDFTHAETRQHLAKNFRTG